MTPSSMKQWNPGQQTYKNLSDATEPFARKLFSFRPNSLSRLNKNNIKAIRQANYGVKSFKQAVLNKPPQLKRWLGTAACVYTQRYHSMRCITHYAHRFFEAIEAGNPVFFVTASSTAHVRPKGYLYKASARQVLRKTKQLVTRYQREKSDFILHGFLEMGVRKNLEGKFLFTPHVHMLVAGLEKEELRDALYPRKSTSEFNLKRPVHIKTLCDEAQVLEKLFYIHKPKFEHKQQYETAKGKITTSRKHTLPNELRAEILDWLSQYYIDDLIINDRGFHRRTSKIVSPSWRRLIIETTKLCKETPLNEGGRSFSAY